MSHFLVGALTFFNKRSVSVFLSVLLPNKRSECERCTNSRILLGRGSCAHYGRDHKSPLTIRLDLPIRQLRRWARSGTKRERTGRHRAAQRGDDPQQPGHTSDTAARRLCDGQPPQNLTYPLARSSRCSPLPSRRSQLPTARRSPAGAPSALAARSMSLASFGEAARMASPSITSPLGGAVTCGAPFKVLSLAAGLVEARFFAAGLALLECLAADLSGGFVSDYFYYALGDYFAHSPRVCGPSELTPRLFDPGPRFIESRRQYFDELRIEGRLRPDEL